MSAIKDQVAPEISRTHVTSLDERTNFLPDRSKYYLLVESAIYKTAGALSRDYSGGIWNFYSLSNGGWYMAPDSESTFYVAVSGNGFAGNLSADAFGIVATLFTTNALAWQLYEKDASEANRLVEQFYALRDYAAEHPEAEQIFNAID